MPVSSLHANELYWIDLRFFDKGPFSGQNGIYIPVLASIELMVFRFVIAKRESRFIVARAEYGFLVVWLQDRNAMHRKTHYGNILYVY